MPKLRAFQREMPYYALVVDKKGSKLKDAAPGGGNTGMRVGPGRIAIAAVPIQILVHALQSVGTGRPIVDMTELKGLYVVNLEWTPQNQPSKQVDGAAAGDRP